MERALWAALRKLKERQTVEEQLACDRSISPDMRRRFKENGIAAASDALEAQLKRKAHARVANKALGKRVLDKYGRR